MLQAKIYQVLNLADTIKNSPKVRQQQVLLHMSALSSSVFETLDHHQVLLVGEKKSEKAVKKCQTDDISWK